MTGINYPDYTKIASLTKSISFELKPYGNTRKTIRDRGFLEIDGEFRNEADRIHPIIDEWVINLTNRALSLAADDLAGLFRELGKIYGEKGKDASKARSDITGRIRKIISRHVDTALPDNYTVSKIKSEKFISEVLMKSVEGDNEKTAFLQAVKGKTGLLDRFLTSRITAVETWMPDRAIENFSKFHENIPGLAAVLDAVPTDDVKNLVSEQMLTDEGYASFLCQPDIETYNRAIIGLSDESGIIKKGLNGIINEFNQRIRGKRDLKPLRKIKKLDKQILIPASSMFSVYTIDDDGEIVELFNELRKIENVALREMKAAVQGASSGDVMVCGDQIRALSHLVYGDFDRIRKSIAETLETELQTRYSSVERKEDRKAFEEELAEVNEQVTAPQTTYMFEDIYRLTGQDVLKNYKAAFTVACRELTKAGDECGSCLETEKYLYGNRVATGKIKAYFEDAWTQIRDLMKIIRTRDNVVNNEFYDVYDKQLEVISETKTPGNLARNYLTRSVKSLTETNAAAYGSAGRHNNKWLIDAKIDINQNAFIRMDGRIYFFTLCYGTKPIRIDGTDEDCQVFLYTKMQAPYQQLPRLTFTRAKKYFMAEPDCDICVITDKLSSPLQISRDLYERYMNGWAKKSTLEAAKKEGVENAENMFRETLTDVIALFIDLIGKYTPWADRNFVFKSPEQYEDLAQFYEDVETAAVDQRWIMGNKALILDLVESGKGLMFEITSQPLNAYYRSGNKEKLSDYEKIFLYMFSEENRTNRTIKLNGRPQLTYRAAVEGKPSVHKRGSILVNRRDINGNPIPEKVYEEIYCYYNNIARKDSLSDLASSYISQNLVATKKAQYDIVKDKRYYEELFQIIISVERNTECSGNFYDINKRVKESAADANKLILVRNTQDIIYMLVMDKNRNVLEERSLNIINGVDYHQRLSDVEAASREKKSEWQQGDKIKTLRDGYFSSAISIIARTAVKYNAILVLERISERTKDKGFALGNSAYKTFEGMLVSRLSDLRFRETEEGLPGSVTNPYQLCDPDQNDAYQNGVVYYFSAGGADTTDPDTGFSCVFDVSRIQTKAAKRLWLSKFNTISYDPKTNGLHVAFDYNNFPTKGVPEQNKWDMVLKTGITEYNREYKYNIFIDHPFEEVADCIYSENIDAETGILQALKEDKLSGKTVDNLYQRLLRALRGYVGSHDGKRIMYISPISGKETDISRNTALNVGLRHAKIMEEKG